MELTVANPLHPAFLPDCTIHGLYVHVPFCFHKCHYCDFYSITHQTPDRMERFVDRVLAEADLWQSRKTVPTTVFFGGGTPSLLPFNAMRRLLRGLCGRFDLSQVDEWTIEVNPATIDADYTAMLFQEGVDRLSFGAQSFDPAELATLQRHHKPADVDASIRIAREAGFKRLNLDLIYAIPGQTLESWMKSLRRAAAYDTGHLSCYGLIYEPNTPMGVEKRLGRIRSAPESLELEMLRQTRSELQRIGLPPYEISNYARPGQECRHNLMYWRGGNYIGLGPSAASHLDGCRWKNIGHLGQWENAVDEGKLPGMQLEHLTPRQRAGEWIMLALRLERGISFADFTRYTHQDIHEAYGDILNRLTALGLLETDGGSARLTDKGLPVGDAVAAEFL